MRDASVDQADDPRDEEIAQLRHALAARVVIEQAKGIMFERFGLAMDDSFELLRQAARSHQIKVRDLAERLVETRETPAAIVDALGRIGEALPEDFAARAARTEQLFAQLRNHRRSPRTRTPAYPVPGAVANPLCQESSR